jgi:hypothetical protein
LDKGGDQLRPRIVLARTGGVGEPGKLAYGFAALPEPGDVVEFLADMVLSLPTKQFTIATAERSDAR